MLISMLIKKMWGNVKYFSYLCSEIIHPGCDACRSFGDRIVVHPLDRNEKSYANEHIYWSNRMSCG